MERTTMNENLKELLTMLIESANPNTAVITAAQIIFDCQAQYGLQKEQTADVPPVNP